LKPKPCAAEKLKAIRVHQGVPRFFGQTHKKVSDFAEDLAATMRASTLGIELDPDKDWNERKMVYQVGEPQFGSRSTAQTARGHKDGLWTTVIACAVWLY
jgi:arginine decarboxylase